MNAAIKEVTGKDPDAYLADYRNHKNMHMQELKEAIGVEARSTILNPKYIKEMMKGKAAAAGQIQEIVTNMHGWEATRPELIDDALWEEVYLYRGQAAIGGNRLYSSRECYCLGGSHRSDA